MKRPRLASTVLAAGLGSGLIGSLFTSPGAERPGGEAGSMVVAAEPRRIGAGSCAARGCHGGVGAADPAHGDVAFAGGEFTTWRTFDPHARAYRVLLGARSRGIADRLKAQLNGIPAHEAPACLSCHSPAAIASPASHPSEDRLAFRAGIDCETCHGPASGWKDAHLSAGWRAKSPASKSEAGMTDLSGPSARARSCVGCHVGARSGDQDVNHDLIAAGHPRLNFEYASYLAAYPRHWRESEGYDEAKAWAVGQAVVAEAAVDLLQDRARSAIGDGKAPWPEFSEYACYSCHRELPATVGGTAGASSSNGLGAARPPLPWATWPLAMIPALAGDRVPDPAPLRSEMSRDEPDPAQVADMARGYARALGRWRLELVEEPFDAGRSDRLMKDLMRGVGADRGEAWDAGVQRFLGLAALARARGGPSSPTIPAEVRSLLETAPNLLAFPPGFDSPRPARSEDQGGTSP